MRCMVVAGVRRHCSGGLDSFHSAAREQLGISRTFQSGRDTESERSMDIDIDGVLRSVGSLRPQRSDLREGILQFPDIHTQEPLVNLQNALQISAVFPEFEQPNEEINTFLGQCFETELLQ